MADVTISQLTRGAPPGNALLPYSTGSNTLGVPVSAVLQTAGNIGINVANPSRKLEVGGVIKTNDWFNVKYPTSIHEYALGPFYTFNDFHITHTTDSFVTHSCRFTILTSGNVGVGTTTPRAGLEVNNESFIQNNVYIKRGTFSIFNINRRIKLTLSNYHYVKLKLYAMRSNSGDSMVWWEGILNNNFGTAYTQPMSQRTASGTISYTLASINGGPPPNENVVPCVWNFDFNNTPSNAWGHYEITGSTNYIPATVDVTTW